MPTIKMKKGYPDSTGFMHDKHADAVKRQCEIDFKGLMLDSGFSADDLEVFEKFDHPSFKIVSDYIKYCGPKPAATPKKKTTKK